MVDAPRRVLTGHTDGGEIDGLNLRAVSARDHARARERLNGFRSPVPVVVAGELAECADIVVECEPAAVFREIAKPVEDAADSSAGNATSKSDGWRLTESGCVAVREGSKPL